MSGKRARASFAVSLSVSPGGAISASPHSSARSCRQSPVPPAADARSAAPVSGHRKNCCRARNWLLA